MNAERVLRPLGAVLALLGLVTVAAALLPVGRQVTGSFEHHLGRPTASSPAWPAWAHARPAVTPAAAPGRAEAQALSAPSSGERQAVTEHAGLAGATAAGRLPGLYAQRRLLATLPLNGITIAVPVPPPRGV